MSKENATETAQENQAPVPAVTESGAKGTVFGFEVDELIREHVYASMALGLVPFPILDMAALAGIQLNLARKLSNQFGEDIFKEERAKKIIASVLGGLSPLLLAPAAFSLLKFVPVVGTTISGVTMPVLFGSITYVVGQVLSSRYVHAGSETMKYDKLGRSELREMFEKAKKEVPAKFSQGLSADKAKTSNPA